jgi:hypothetical protein
MEWKPLVQDLASSVPAAADAARESTDSPRAVPRMRWKAFLPMAPAVQTAERAIAASQPARQDGRAA